MKRDSILGLLGGVVFTMVPAEAQQLEYVDSRARHASVQDIDLDCHSEFPVAIAGNASNFDLSVWDDGYDVTRLDYVQRSSNGPVALATGQGIAGSANFKVVTASVGGDGTAIIRVWGVGGGQLLEMSSRPFPLLPKYPVKMELAWTSSGITLASLAPDGTTLDLQGFDVNFVTGSIGGLNRQTVLGVTDVALDGHPSFPESTVVLRTNSGLSVRPFEPAQGELGDPLFGTPNGFSLADIPPGTRTGFDVSVAKNSLERREIYVVALSDSDLPFRISASGATQISDVAMSSVAAVAGPGSPFTDQAMGERRQSGVFMSASAVSDCDPTFGQPAVAAQGCFINPAPEQVNPLDDLGFSVKIAESGKMRISSWQQRSCLVVDQRPPPPPPPETSGTLTIDYSTAAVLTEPVAGESCAGIPAPQPAVSLRWTPAMTGPVPGGAISALSQVEIRRVGASCAAPGDPRGGDTTREPVARDCLVIHANVNETATSLTPSTNYVWRVRAYTPNNGGSLGLLSPFTAFTPFRVAGPPEKAVFIAPNPEPEFNFPTEGKTITLGRSAVAGTTVSIRWEPPSCLPSSFESWMIEKTETMLPCPEEEGSRSGSGNGRMGEEECKPETVVNERPTITSGACSAGLGYCQVNDIYVGRDSENTFHLEQFNAFGSSYSKMNFDVE